VAAENARIDSVATYFALGRSGLRVSPLCLGTMTFGTEWGWGNDAETSRAILHRYLEAGGNFLDTADGYTNGHSEELLGQFLSEGSLRERVVLATKYSFNAQPGDPNAGGNARKNLVRALESSLRRLRTDYIDLYWLHAWDTITPVEEVMRALDAQVRAGKIRYIGLSNTPAWYLARAQTLAELRGYEPVAALQLEYSLVDRSIEREHVGAALELGMGICPWSPLASGFLSGKYSRGEEREAQGRLAVVTEPDHPLYNKLTERNYAILDVLLAVARELGRSPSQVALNWITKRPAVSSTLIGATKLKQLDDNLTALAFDIPAELSARLEAASRPELCAPYMFYGPPIQGGITGGARIAREPPWFRPR
jgi:aryl-alcohol dehydrogenase-like predicted oxidoreductase